MRKLILLFVRWLSMYNAESLEDRQLQCDLFGHPWEWWCYPWKASLKDEGWCRKCGRVTSKYPRMRAFIEHDDGGKPYHKWDCEIKDK